MSLAVGYDILRSQKQKRMLPCFLVVGRFGGRLAVTQRETRWFGGSGSNLHGKINTNLQRGGPSAAKSDRSSRVIGLHCTSFTEDLKNN